MMELLVITPELIKSEMQKLLDKIQASRSNLMGDLVAAERNYEIFRDLKNKYIDELNELERQYQAIEKLIKEPT